MGHHFIYMYDWQRKQLLAIIKEVGPERRCWSVSFPARRSTPDSKLAIFSKTRHFTPNPLFQQIPNILWLPRYEALVLFLLVGGLFVFVPLGSLLHLKQILQMLGLSQAWRFFLLSGPGLTSFLLAFTRPEQEWSSLQRFAAGSAWLNVETAWCKKFRLQLSAERLPGDTEGEAKVETQD